MAFNILDTAPFFIMPNSIAQLGNMSLKISNRVADGFFRRKYQINGPQKIDGEYQMITLKSEKFLFNFSLIKPCSENAASFNNLKT